MELKEITSCRICGNNDLIEIMNLGEHALSSRFPARNEADPPKAPLVLLKCNDQIEKGNCGLVQLKHEVPKDELYCCKYGYRSSINKTMRDHLEEIVCNARKLANLKSRDIVLDIGSNDATLLGFYPPQLIRIGIDPTGRQFKKFYPADIKLVSDFFTSDNFRKVSKDNAKIITSIAMFYDLSDPCTFASEVKSCLAEDGFWIFEQSYLPFMLDTNSFDTVCHEHLEYYGLKQINEILKRSKMKAIDIDFNEINGGSFRITATHIENRRASINKKLEEAILKEKEMELDTLEPYKRFVERVNLAKEELTSFIISERARGKKFYIYGASTKGNTLLQYFGLDNKIFIAAAERNPEKYGRRTPITNIPIVSEEEARAAKPDYFMVLPWHFKKEIMERERSYIRNGGKLLFPLPKFEVVGK